MGPWLATFGIVLVSGFYCWIRGYDIATDAAGLEAAAIAFACWAAFTLYAHKRLPRFVAPLHAAAQLVICSLALGFLQYPSANLGRPLVDDAMMAFDAQLGIDWLGYFHFVEHHDTLATAMQWIYNGLLPQLPLVVFLVGFVDPVRLRRFVAADMICLGTTLVIAAMWPVAGAFVAHGVDYSFNPYPVQFAGARDGSITVLHLSTMAGIIQFPSYHAGLASLVIYAVGRLPRWVAWPVWTFEAGIIIAAPVYGGHYIADIAGGLAVTVFSIVAAEVLDRRHSRGRSSLSRRRWHWPKLPRGTPIPGVVEVPTARRS